MDFDGQKVISILMGFIFLPLIVLGQRKPDSTFTGHFVFYGIDRPDSGIADSAKVEEADYVNGKKEGTCIKYHKDGATPKLIGKYTNNRPLGPYSKYYDTGTLKETGIFEKGLQRDTLKRFHPNGQLRQLAWYNEKGKENGRITFYYDDGQVEYTFVAKNGLEDSCYRYDPCGNLIEMRTIKYNPRKKDDWEWDSKVYDADCDIKAKSGRKVEPTPRPIVDPRPPGFNPNGYNKVYNEAGEIWLDGLFKDGSLIDGKVYVYDADGILLKVQVFKAPR